MHIIYASGVNDAWPRALQYMMDVGVKQDSRAGRVTLSPWPVATVYHRPWERVLFDPQRDANPIFHLHEALWMLSGRDDATWLDQFVGDFSKRFAEKDGHQHGAYGRRWRNWFVEGFRVDDWQGEMIDQLSEVVRLLKSNPLDRQAVIQMWDATHDLGIEGLADRPCNTQIYLRCDREGAPDVRSDTGVRFLDMTVTARSNDIVYGCYGANVVHFSILLEYLAARIGCNVGTYTQVSNNWHIYEWAETHANIVTASRWTRESWAYPGTTPIVDDPDSFDEEVKYYVQSPRSPLDYRNRFLQKTAQQMFFANAARKNGDYNVALEMARAIEAPDWRLATMEWLGRRAK